MTRPNVELAQLYALRAQLDAIILAAEARLGLVPGEAAGGCPQCGTAADQLQDTSTLDGTRRRRCPNCGAEWEL